MTGAQHHAARRVGRTHQQSAEGRDCPSAIGERRGAAKGLTIGLGVHTLVPIFRQEIAIARVTERGATRGDDRFSEAAMEDRKKEGYF